MVGSPVVPRILSVPSSLHPLTEIHPDWFPSVKASKRLTDFWKWCRAIRLSGCITPKKADKLPSVDVVRQVAPGLNRLHRWGPWSFGGWWWFGMSGYFEVVGEDEESGEGFGDEVFCSVIFLFILIYYNNEIPPVVLHSYSENYIFFEYGNLFFSKDEDGVSKWKTPTFRRVRKNMIKKIEEYLYLSLFSCS